MNPNFSVHPNNFNSITLFGLSLCNYAPMYWAHIFLARPLSINAFDNFNVAVSVLTVLSTIATLGLEKYALRMVALYIEQENWPRLRGFWHFSIRIILLCSLIIMGCTSVGLSVIRIWQQAESHNAILIYVLFLPVIALCLYLTEAITVFGAQVAALALYRFVLPLLFLLLIFASNQLHPGLTAETVVLCFGVAWLLTLLLMLAAAQFTQPQSIRAVKSDYQGKIWWLKRSLPLMISSLLMTLLGSAGTILLAILNASPSIVGICAIAMKSSGFIALLGTSTNRYYLPMLVVLIHRRDRKGVNDLLSKRGRLIGGFVLIFLTTITLWGQEILSLFGPVFSKGYGCLLICAIGTGFMTLFSDALYYLQFMERNRLVIGLLSIAAISMLLLGSILGTFYGATRMAIAFALPTTILFCLLKWQAKKHMLHHLQSKSGAHDTPRAIKTEMLAAEKSLKEVT